MNTALIAVAALLAGGILAFLVFVLIQGRRKQQDSTVDTINSSFQTLTAEIIKKQMEGMSAIQNSLTQSTQLLNERMSESNRSLDQKVQVFGEIKTKIGELAVQAKNMESIGQNIQSLSELLKPPKLRGNVGETFLDNILSQILPRALYELQHAFPSGQRVDAVIKFGDRLLPIDSKFPLEAFNKHIDNPESVEFRKQFSQSIKKHIDDTGSRYVLPQEGTLEFAIMYIPAESIYYQLVSRETEVLDYALSKKVIPSSPGHLYGFLMTISAIYRETGLINQGRQLSSILNKLADSLQKVSGLHERMDGSVRSLTLSLAKARDEARNAEQHLGRLQKPEGVEKTESGELEYFLDNQSPN